MRRFSPILTLLLTLSATLAAPMARAGDDAELEALKATVREMQKTIDGLQRQLDRLEDGRAGAGPTPRATAETQPPVGAAAAPAAASAAPIVASPPAEEPKLATAPPPAPGTPATTTASSPARFRGAAPPSRAVGPSSTPTPRARS